jgi:NitT/TauT family transport system ATP-binding protein
MLTADELSHTYPNGIAALDGITLRIAQGERVAIVGPSGCGKSTLLRIYAGLIAPTAGRVLLDDEPITRPTRRVGIMFQDAALLPWRTVAQNIQLPLEMGDFGSSKIPLGRNADRAFTRPPSDIENPKSKIQNLIALVGLTGFEHTYPRELSGGMAQRVALARALIMQPPALLLDEPFGALDAMTRESLTTALEDIVTATGTTAVMVTHNIAEAVFFADRVVVLSPRPGHVTSIIHVTLPRPRNWKMESNPAFGEKVGDVREALAG